MTQAPDDVIGSWEACDILRISRATISRWAADGRLPAAGKLPKKNGALFFLRSVVEAKRDELAAAELSA